MQGKALWPSNYKAETTSPKNGIRALPVDESDRQITAFLEQAKKIRDGNLNWY